MFGSIGITELMLIAGVALVFLGPDKFPEFAKIVARTIRDVRGYVQDAQRDISEELKPIKKELNQLSQYNPEDYLERLADSAEEGDDEKSGDGESDAGDDGASEGEGSEDIPLEGYPGGEIFDYGLGDMDEEDEAAEGESRETADSAEPSEDGENEEDELSGTGFGV